MAVAALAVFAVAAVMLLSGSNPAQATSATLAPDHGSNVIPEQGGGNPTPEPTPEPTPRTHATPEPCPGEDGNDNALALVVDSGHIALFDVYWNDDEGELTNNPCPPTVMHDSASSSDTRSPSNINISKTIIHIPNSAKVDLSASTTYTETKYPDVWAADKLENRDTDGDGTPDDVGDGMVWALPACPPDGSSEAVALCISFSAALLNDSDWAGNIEYHLDHVHQIDIDKQDPRHVLGYNVPAAGVTVANTPLWDSSDARIATMTVAPGEYDRPIWFFTSRGTYEFQVHIKGSPEQDSAELHGQDPVSKDPSVTSDVREYVVHVGAEADLDIEVKFTPENPSPGDNVAIEITASNAGPSDAEKTKVDVSLPEGLTYSSHVATTGTYNSTDGVWEIGELAVTDDDNSETDDDSPTLTITATVDANTRGKTLDPKATISATETVKITETVDGVEKVVTRDLPVLDPNPDNDTAAASTTVASSANVDPMFQVTRSVPENSAVGTNVGDPIAAKEPNTGDTLTFTLVGDGADAFTVSGVAGRAQIAVAANADLDYETIGFYDLTLQVSDSKDHAGNTDTAIDHSIGVQIEIIDVLEFTVTLSASDTSPTVGDNITFTVSIENSPVPVSELHWRWGEQNHPVGDAFAASGTGDPGTRSVTYNGAVRRDYHMAFWRLDEHNNVVDEVETNVVQVTWNSN